ncbi:LuxR C-terminal-related transcriptional regulator [Caldimonas sp. KR1-144]|uniref:LuxR C-terminal-related transcriptional regulator n=1 Tax=Caldimonas sp. KR1-144 TaxID=3400911 RepID=UPI003C03EACB
MSFPTRFALTKLQPPRLRPGLIERTELEQRLLDATVDARLVLMSAPAGAGKTVVLTRLLSRLGSDAALAWFALDEDDDLGRVAAGLVAALEPFDLPWRTSPDALVLAAQDGQRASRQAFVAALVNALAASGRERGLIVLDDAHRVTDPAVFELIDALLERLPANWSLLMSTRMDPPLALPRLRARGELAEFRQEDLGFSPDEVRSLVQLQRPGCSDDEVQALHARTQGWAAGLGLALGAASPQRASLAGSRLDRHAFDYLASEVLDDMPAELRTFLLRCSVLPELTAERCAAVTGDARAADWLEEIERRGLFVAVLDADERTLVLHDLFRDCLDDRLRRELPEELPRLLVRAAQGERDATRQVGFLARAADWPAAEAALAAASNDLLLQGALHELQRLIELFPAPWRDASARLQRIAAIAHCQHWQWHEMAQCLRDAVRLARVSGPPEELALSLAYLATAERAIGHAAAAQAAIDELAAQPGLDAETRGIALLADCGLHFDRGEIAPVPALFAQVLDAIEPSDDLLLWWKVQPASAWSTIRGMRVQMLRYLSGAARRLGERSMPFRGSVHIQRAWCYLWGGEVDRALDEAATAEADVRWLACSADIEVNVVVFRMLADALRGRAEAVAPAIEALLAREDGTTAERAERWRHQAAIFAVRLTEIMGSDAAALRRFGALQIDRPLERPPVGEDLGDDGKPKGRVSTLHARVAAAEGRWHDAAELYLRLLPYAPHLDLMGQCIEVQLRCGHALARERRLAEAAGAIRPALQRMVSEGEHGHALMCGHQVLSELAQQPWGALLDDDEQQQLRRAAALSRHLRDPAALSAPAAEPAPGALRAAGADDPLSAREREVLERIAAGDSNKVIARSLDLSPHTVKRHVANILDKLALASRGQAAAWYRDHG